MNVSFHSLPTPILPFIGRETELGEIRRRLAEPGCRLLTLTGPGGIGKTRLAVEAAQACRDLFADGVFFVNLQPVQSTGFLIPAIADTLELPLSGQDEPQQQLRRYLEQKDMLLLLDNMEHLADGADLISSLLQHTGRLKILVTSREALNLVEEHLYPVRGMAYPAAGQAGDLTGYPAVQLFVACARRIRPDFDLEAEREGVVQICELVEGMPLALELAATWTRVLTCSEIAAEVRSNIGILATNLRNIPERHRNMQAVFEQSWKMLKEDERRVFRLLAVFRGGFRRESARVVAGASLPVLSTLVDKSLLRRESSQPEGERADRYSIHELLHQFAAERLKESPEEETQAHERHCTYYADFMEKAGARFRLIRQEEAVEAVQAEYENVRAAWLWAAQHGKAAELVKMYLMLEFFHQIESRYVEGAALFEMAARDLEEAVIASTDQKNDPDHLFALALVTNTMAWFYIRIGRLEEAYQAAERSHALLDQIQRTPPPGIGSEPLSTLAVLAQIRGDYEQAVALAGQVRQLSIARGDPLNQSIAEYTLASASLAQGQPELARQHAQAAYQLAKANHQRWFMAYCLIQWGDAARAMGDYAEARTLYESCYAIRESFNDPEGMAIALNHLGQVAILQGEAPAARQLFRQSLEIYEKIDDQGGLATAMNGLALAAIQLGEYHRARHHAWEALRTAARIHYVPLALNILSTVAELLIATGKEQRGGELLAYTRQHPKTDHETLQRLEQLAAQHPNCLEDRQFSGPAGAPDYGLAEVVDGLLQELTVQPVPDPEQETPLPVTASPSKPAGQALVEPLSEREVEVLESMALGLSNQEIAKKLYLSIGTIKWYTSQIYSKLGVNSRTRAIARARELQILS